MITGIVVALPEELSTLTTKKLAKGCVETLVDKILVIYSGAGAENACAASELLVRHGALCLISWGCAAALVESLRPGELVLANSCIDADHLAFDLNNEDWLIHVKDCLSKRLTVRTYTGKLAESKAIVASSHDKAQIGSATGAIALDMESAVIARVAQAHDLPFLSIRAIADPLNMDLPKAVSHALNDQGEIILSKLLFYLLLHLTELPSLLRLGLHFRAAKKTLKLVAKQLDDVITPPQSAPTNPTQQ
ncbi:phosphorylase [Methyloglobulus sp.]|uniref:phosphorylase family protein n=1 Tax=Methyloglobulus sp. TaxID=2518622 RepID=UPI00398A2350